MKNKILKELIKKRNLIEIQKYINANDFVTYNYVKGNHFLPLKYGCLFNKTADFKEIEYDSKEANDIENMLDYGLFRIDDNKVAINKIKDKLKPFALYEYFISRNNLLLTYWSASKDNKDLTGNVKLCYPMYYAYKIDENVLYKKIKKSDLVEDLDEIENEYPYIKNHFYTYITKDIGLDFEQNIDNTRKLVK